MDSLGMNLGGLVTWVTRMELDSCCLFYNLISASGGTNKLELTARIFGVQCDICYSVASDLGGFLELLSRIRAKPKYGSPRPASIDARTSTEGLPTPPPAMDLPPRHQHLVCLFIPFVLFPPLLLLQSFKSFRRWINRYCLSVTWSIYLFNM